MEHTPGQWEVVPDRLAAFAPDLLAALEKIAAGDAGHGTHCAVFRRTAQDAVERVRGAVRA